VYCGASLTTGKYDWVLRDVQRYTPELFQKHVEDVQNLRESGESVRAASALDPQLSLAVLARVMLADGMTPAERNALVRMGGRRGLTEAQVLEFVNQASSSEVDLPVPANPAQARACLSELITAMLVDGNISRAEQRLLATYAQRIGLSMADVKLAINRERSRSYQQAREALRG
jgi:hypothetical protein